MAELKERYAGALLELSLESENLEEQIKEATFVRDVLDREESRSFLTHPTIPNKAKFDFFKTLFSDNISKDIMNFLYLLVEKKREKIIIPALSSYIGMGNKQLGNIVAKVVSATELREEQIIAINNLLTKKLKKQVEIYTDVNPDLIGGFYIYIEGRLIDRTVRSELYNMKNSLLRGGIE